MHVMTTEITIINRAFHAIYLDYILVTILSEQL